MESSFNFQSCSWHMAACFSRVPERTEPLMPMIDLDAPNDLLPTGSDRRIGEALTLAVLRAEGVAAPGPFHLENTAAFIHRMDPATVQTAAQPIPRTIRIQIITPPRALNRDGQKQLVKDATGIMADICGDPSQANGPGCF